MSGNKVEGPANADVQPGANYNAVGLTARNGTSKLYYIPADATLALDQGISPQWSSAHTFLSNINFGASAFASLGQDGASLKYAVGSGVHAFYVSGKAVGQIDDPTNPAGGTSLVSKSYVDSHGGSGSSVQPGKPVHPAVSIGNTVTDGSAATYLRSDAVLQLDQRISPQWSSVHTFLGGIDFGAPATASLGLNGVSLKYSVGKGQTHGFYVGGALAGVIDNPSNPSGDTSLVSKAYVDEQVVPPTLQKYVAISALPLGIDDAPATTGSSHGSLAIGRNAAASADGGVALGDCAAVSGAVGIAIGNLAVSTGANSIALGNFAEDGGQSNVLSIGNHGGGGPTLRRILNVADGQNETDAATVGQLKNLNVGAGAYVAFSSANTGTTAPAAATSNDSMAIGMGAAVSGSYSVAIGKQISVPSDESVAIGYQSYALGFQSVALGSYSGDQGQGNVVSIGWSAEGSPAVQRRIINVTDGQASNEAATFGQLQAHTSPRLGGYFDGGFSNLPDGIQGPQINALENWPICSAGILQSGADATSVAKLTKHAATGALTFCVCLNGAKIGTVSFRPGQQVGAISFDKNVNAGDGNWTVQVGDLLTLTNPHPPVSGAEQASGLLVVIVSSVRWTCTAT